MSTLKQYEKFEKEELPKMEEDYKNSIIEAVNKMSEIAFEIGIEIPKLIIKDTMVQVDFPYGNLHKIKAPDIKQIETDFGTIILEKN